MVIDAEDTMNIAQFYLAGPFQKQGIGSKALQFLFAQNPQIKNWYVDTIYEETKRRFLFETRIQNNRRRRL